MCNRHKTLAVNNIRVVYIYMYIYDINIYIYIHTYILLAATLYKAFGPKRGEGLRLALGVATCLEFWTP